MEELGLLELLLPFLSAHLRAHAGPAEESPTARNLAALGRALYGGLGPDHAIVLAAMFLDFARESSPERERMDLLGELRSRGFARGDTERMRLLVEAFEHLVAPSRRTRRLMRRPYFADARRFFEMMAPTYGIDPMVLTRFLADPEGYLARGAARSSSTEPVAPGGRRRHRRRRRRGRQRHAPRPPSAIAANGRPEFEGGANPDAQAPRDAAPADGATSAPAQAGPGRRD
jgi:hypothetical protein